MPTNEILTGTVGIISVLNLFYYFRQEFDFRRETIGSSIMSFFLFGFPAVMIDINMILLSEVKGPLAGVVMAITLIFLILGIPFYSSRIKNLQQSWRETGKSEKIFVFSGVFVCTILFLQTFQWILLL